jgi:CheY-like chemotaxis protein
VLVAENKSMVSIPMVEYVEAMGFNVVEAKGGYESVELLKLHWADVVLVILDINIWTHWLAMPCAH